MSRQMIETTSFVAFPDFREPPTVYLCVPLLHDAIQWPQDEEARGRRNRFAVAMIEVAWIMYAFEARSRMGHD